ncbi:MAG: hypothetical protein CG440_761 [Methanosaeta sp. NSM2]|nr:hypothetical protein [Methanothrix sp.]OYV14218.1 MAG: hypothetical protein CG440_761 [Methanosaeta sp. NSM2]
MNDIRYVCLSDMHFGEEDSLLTEMDGKDVDPLKASQVLVHLAGCLRELISKNQGSQKPTLILNGDILELALSEYNTSAMIFERFMELVMPRWYVFEWGKIPGKDGGKLIEYLSQNFDIDFANTAEIKKTNGDSAISISDGSHLISLELSSDKTKAILKIDGVEKKEFEAKDKGNGKIKICAEGRELFERIIYIPGNHDHHLWELARETQYVEYIDRHPNKRLDLPWHKTEMFILEGTEEELERNVSSYFLDKVLKRRSNLDIDEEKVLRDDIQIYIAYPNFGILSEDKEKCVVIHHGHFVEQMYCIMSRLKADLLNIDSKTPNDVQLFESENFAWIDFLWSALGRSGQVGALTETFYEHMLDEEQKKNFFTKVASNLAKKYGPRWTDPFEKRFLKFIFERISDRERGAKDEALGEDGRKGMLLYLDAVKNQIINEREGELPSELSFVFGHTHKPFLSDQCNVTGFKKPVAVYNTGGWVVDTVQRKDIFGGAVLLMDENLDACLLEMYRENESLEGYKVKALHLNEGITDSIFYRRINEIVGPADQPAKKPWAQFSNIVSLDVKARAERLDIRLKAL